MSVDFAGAATKRKFCFIYPGQPPLLAPCQSPSPTAVPVSESQIVTAVYPPSPSITVATGVVSMTAVPPGAVHSVSSPSSASPHILSKHTAAATAVTHTHPPLHLDRPSERHLPLDRPADRQMDRQSERPAEMLTPLERQSERQGQTCSSGSSVAPPSGSTVPMRANSPLPVQTCGTSGITLAARSRSTDQLLIILCLETFFRQRAWHAKINPAASQDLSEGEGDSGEYPGGELRRRRPRKRERERQREGARSCRQWPLLLRCSVVALNTSGGGAST